MTSFLTFASVGLTTGLIDGLQWPFWWVLAKAAFSGVIGGLSFATILRNPKIRFLVVIPLFVLLVVMARIQPGLQPTRCCSDPV